MIIAAQAILESFLRYNEAFVARYPRLADPFASQFKVLIENVLKTYFGINSREQLKKTTAMVNQLQGVQRIPDLLKNPNQRGIFGKARPQGFPAR